jgi:hypothetical protein
MFEIIHGSRVRMGRFTTEVTLASESRYPLADEDDAVHEDVDRHHHGIVGLQSDIEVGDAAVFEANEAVEPSPA